MSEYMYIKTEWPVTIDDLPGLSAEADVADQFEWEQEVDEWYHALGDIIHE